MSNCMTIADETIDRKDTRTDITPKDVVDLILEEALLSAFVVSDKGCSRIGDFNVTDDFRQQDQLPHLKDFEQVDHSRSTETQESNLDAGEIVDRSARENLELLIDSFVKKEEKPKPAGEYKVITEEILANNELQIQNGQIHLEKNEADKEESERSRFGGEDVVADETECLNESELNEIYVPSNACVAADAEQKEQREEAEGGAEGAEQVAGEGPERPFEPFTTEELRQSTLQVWGKESSSFVGEWDGDASAQREEAVRLMEELSSVRVFRDTSADPNRPRACALAEEDVKKMIREIEEISFTQCQANTENLDSTYHPDGQGDADLESKSLTKSKENISKPEMGQKQQENSRKIPETESSDRSKQISTKGAVSRENQWVELTWAAVPGSATESAHRGTPRGSSAPSVGGRLHSREEAAAEERRHESTAETSGGPEGALDPAPGQQESPDSDDDDDPSCASLLMPKEEHKTSQVFPTDSENLKDYQNASACDEFFPETASLSGHVGSLSGSKLDEFTPRSMEFTSELDVRAFQGKRSDGTRGTRRVDDALQNASELTNQGTVSLGRLTAVGSETNERLDPDSFSKERGVDLVSMETGVFVKKSEEMRKSQDAGNFLQGSELSVEIDKNQEDSALIREGSSKKLEIASVENNTENIESRDNEPAGSEVIKIEEMEDTNTMANRSSADRCDNDKSLNRAENRSCSDASDRQQTPSLASLGNEAPEEDGSCEECDVATQKFKLQSQKMYLGASYEVSGQSPNEFALTESEEAFIDMTESVIQIIDPPETNIEEDSSKISFSLLSEVPNLKPLSRNVDRGPETSSRKTDSGDVENLTKRVYSGMTTIGPIKNVEHDPKDLTAPEIDFGKMTRITSSRQLANDIGLFNPDATPVKILEEDDSDENASLNIEADHLERTSLVNRDIASLTKVQKIREVMSYQPKSEEDFEDDEVLARPRLDLKDVESMTDERYKVPDVSIPLMSFEIGESDLNAEKELMESMSLVISGLTNPTYYVEEIEDDGAVVQRNACELDTESNKSGNELLRKESSKMVTNEKEREMAVLSWEKESKSKSEMSKESEKAETPRIRSLESQVEGALSYQKCGTLGSVFKKASSRLMRKDGDLFARNSKSLPRDASRTSATDSIRSMLDDCQSSASNILKKSRSLLKNTQSVFKSISQGRVSPDSGAGRSADQKKPFSPSESDVTAADRKFSGFLGKEDFAKAKNLIKGKVEKALRSIDAGSLEGSEPEILPEKRDLRVAIINKENLQVDRMENFKKLLPKTPLVYKSQFVKSQMNVQSNPSESTPDTAKAGEDEDQKISQVALNGPVFEENGGSVPNETELEEQAGSDKQIPFQEKLQWINSGENVKSPTNEDAEPKQPDFIIMETVRGLPAGSDLESPSSEKENLNVDGVRIIETEKEGKEPKKTTEASNSLQAVPDGGHDVAPCFPEIDDEKAVTKSPSERKIKTKKKKLTARFRSFWCSAFGRVKTPPAKADLS